MSWSFFYKDSKLKDNKVSNFIDYFLLIFGLIFMVIDDVWKLHLHGNDRSLHLHINSCTTSQEMMLLENQWTAVKRVEERKTCKRQESDRKGHWFRAGLGGSDAFVSRSLSKKP